MDFTSPSPDSLAQAAREYLTLTRCILLLASLLTLFRLVQITKGLLFGKLKHIPGPFLSTISGIDLTLATLQGRRAYRLLDLHDQYGPIVRVNPNEVSVADWKHYRVIYNNHKTIEKDPTFYSAATFVGKDNLFSMINSRQHAARRKISAPPYSLQSVAYLTPMIRHFATELATELIRGAAVSPTRTVDAFELCGLYSFKVICSSAFAKEFDTRSKDGTDSDASKLLKAMDGSAPTLLFDSLLPFLKSWGIAESIPGFVGDCYRKHRYWREMSHEMVDHFLQSVSQDDKHILTPLANTVDSFLGRKLSHDELVEEAMGVMFAGSGTTSTTLTYLLYALSLPENCKIQERLRNEVLSIQDDIIAVRNNAYVNAIIMETLRLYPTIISTLPRVLLEPLQLSPEYSLPAGTTIGMQNYVHHRNPSIFPSPAQFLPERWLNASEEMKASLTPFSVGRRNCIGQNLAWEELYMAVNVLMREGLEIRIGREMKPRDMDMEDRFNIAPRGRRLMLEVSKVQKSI